MIITIFRTTATAKSDQKIAMFSQDPERMVTIQQRAQLARKSRSRSRGGNKRDPRNAPVKVSRPVARTTMERTKTLLAAALRLWELKRRLPAD